MHARAALVLLVAVSGCTAAQPQAIDIPPASQGPLPHAPDAIVTATTGSVTGSVIDEELAVVPGANVSVEELPDLATTTALDGTFTFNELPEGHFTIHAARTGYASGSTQVDVAVEAVTRAIIRVKSVPIPVPYPENWQHDGFMDLGIGTPVISPRPNGPSTQLTWSHDILPGLNATVSSMVWTSSAAFSANRFRLAIDTNGDSFYDGPGASPHVVWYTNHSIDEPGFIRHDVLVPVTCNPTDPATCAAHPPTSVLDPVVGQRFTIYVTAFYNSFPAPGFSNLPDA